MHCKCIVKLYVAKMKKLVRFLLSYGYYFKNSQKKLVSRKWQQLGKIVYIKVPNFLR